MKHIFSQFLAALLVTSVTPIFAQPVTASIRRDASTPTAAKPKLVVVIVMDQVREEYLTRYAKYFGSGGFNRLTKGGANFLNANYSHATTYTGPGHAQILSGSFGHSNGVIGNSWWNPKTKAVELMFYDADAQIVTGDSFAWQQPVKTIESLPSKTERPSSKTKIAQGLLYDNDLAPTEKPQAQSFTGPIDLKLIPVYNFLYPIKLDPKLDDTSPRNFIGDNLCDQLLLSNHFHSKAIGISIKDRAAIMLAGKLGKAFWMHDQTGGMVTSTYYSQDLPAWMKTFNAQKIPDSYFGKTWTKSLPEAEYSLSRPEGAAYETNFHGLGKTFPHLLTDPSGKPGKEFYDAFTATPFGTDYTLAAARAAIENESLGEDEYPDILAISITPPDIAGHTFGADSPELQDMMARLDGQFAKFFDYLDTRFKRGEVLIALTSDHGATPIPEYMQSLGIEAGRIKKKQIADAIDAALDANFGKPEGDAKWIWAMEDPAIYLNRDLISAKKLNAAEVQQVAGEAAMTVPGMLAFYTAAQFQSGALPDNHWAKMFEKSFYAPRSGDVILQTKPFYFWGNYGEKETGSTHGSPYDYDTHVPLVLYGAGIRAGEYSGNVDMSDLAPTLATILKINPPAESEGRVLNEALWYWHSNS